MAAIRMQMEHIAVINEGKQFAIFHLASRKLVTKHVLSGRFISEKVVLW